MVVNVSPFTCMPGTITGAIFRQMSSQKGIPIVNMYYDGTVGVNEKITTFLKNLKHTTPSHCTTPHDGEQQEVRRITNNNARVSTEPFPTMQFRN